MLSDMPFLLSKSAFSSFGFWLRLFGWDDPQNYDQARVCSRVLFCCHTRIVWVQFAFISTGYDFDSVDITTIMSAAG